jgi:hypothetical protein
MTEKSPKRSASVHAQLVDRGLVSKWAVPDRFELVLEIKDQVGKLTRKPYGSVVMKNDK